MLLNNDAVVTDGWLDQLVALTAARLGTVSEATRGNDAEILDTKGTKRDKDLSEGAVIEPGSLAPVRTPHGTARIGLDGPMSNYAPPQLVADVPYRDLDAMQDFAWRWREEHRGRWLAVPNLSGFCLMMTRVVYEAIGGLDERFELGLFDDVDLAERARRAGFALAVAQDLFVHHFGSRTFVGNGIDAEALLAAVPVSASAGEVRQPGHRHLRASHAAESRRAGPGVRRRGRGRQTLACGAG